MVDNNEGNNFDARQDNDTHSGTDKDNKTDADQDEDTCMNLLLFFVAIAYI